MAEAQAVMHSQERVDVEEHERRAAVFWAVCSLLVAIFTSAAAPNTKIMQPGGIVFFVSYFAANLIYAVRIAVGPARGDLERLAVASFVTAALAVQQYLAGALPMLPILLPLFVLGAVAVLERPQRVVYLPVVMATALSPLLYHHVDARSVVIQVTLMIVLVMEMAMLGEYGDRLRSQRHQLIEAEALSAHRAITDELTGLRNRRALVQQISPTATIDLHATVIYCDLDGFKPFNDRFGHSAGDALLCRLGQTLRDAVGARGTAYRVGGDEFCIVLDGCLPADASIVAGIVKSLTENGPGYEVECSYGVATTPDDAVDLAGALQVADERMFIHKRDRRQLLGDADAEIQRKSTSGSPGNV
jgi:diguanylate cyclase (GGDEF)-like protein